MQYIFMLLVYVLIYQILVDVLVSLMFYDIGWFASISILLDFRHVCDDI